MPPKTTTTVSMARETIPADPFADAPLFAGILELPRKEPPLPNPSPSKAKQAKAGTPSSAKRNAKGAPRADKKAPAKPSKALCPDAVLLSVAEMCRLLGISRATLVRMDNGNKIPGRIKLGGSVRYHREVVEAWLKELASPGQTQQA